jgi:hypothetical protein
MVVVSVFPALSVICLYLSQLVFNYQHLLPTHQPEGSTDT